MKKRKIRKYRNQRKNSGVKFLTFIGIMIIAVVCGYLAARYVIGPMLGYDTEVLKLDFPSKFTAFLDGDKTEDEADSEKDAEETDKSDQDGETAKDDNKDSQNSESGNKVTAEKGYALQFGLFSTKERAEETLSKVEDLGVEGKILKVDNQYKVIGDIMDSKEKALNALQKLDTDKFSDVFITTIK